MHFLAKHRLADYCDAFTELGATVPEDLTDVEQEDLVTMGMPKLAVKRFHRAMEELRA